MPNIIHGLQRIKRSIWFTLRTTPNTIMNLIMIKIKNIIFQTFTHICIKFFIQLTFFSNKTYIICMNMIQIQILCIFQINHCNIFKFRTSFILLNFQPCMILFNITWIKHTIMRFSKYRFKESFDQSANRQFKMICFPFRHQRAMN